MVSADVWVMLEGDMWMNAPLTEAQNVTGLKTEIKRALASKILTGQDLNDFNTLRSNLAMKKTLKNEYNQSVDILCETVDISLRGVNIETVLKEGELYDDQKHLAPLKMAAKPLVPQHSLLNILNMLGTTQVDKIDAKDMNTIRKKFAEKIWIFAYSQGKFPSLNLLSIHSFPITSLLLTLIIYSL